MDKPVPPKPDPDLTVPMGVPYKETFIDKIMDYILIGAMIYFTILISAYITFKLFFN